MIKREDIIAAARECVAIKVPFLHQGRNPETGLDCIGLVLHCFYAAGWTPCNTATALQTDYGRVPENTLLLEGIRNEAFEIPIEDTLAGDVLLMKFHVEPLPRHIALVSYPREGHAYIIHTDQSLGGASETILAARDRNRVVAAYRLLDFQD